MDDETYEHTLAGVGLDDYERGYVRALYAYAWMKDGTYYVGSGMRTLRSAVEHFMNERHADPQPAS